MRVLHAIPSLGPARGGPSAVLPPLAAALVRHGVNVDVVCTDDNGPERLEVPLKTYLPRDGARYLYFPRQTTFYQASLPLTAWLARNISVYDVVHVHALFSYVPSVAALLARGLGVPYIVRPLGTLDRWGRANRRPHLKGISHALVERHIVAGAAALHFTSDEERDQARDVIGDARAAIIPLGVDLRAFARSEPREIARPLRLLYLSRIDRKKGLDMLLRALALVNAKGIEAELRIAGDGDPVLTDQLQELCDQLGIRGQVEWLGFVGGEEKRRVLGTADAFVLPSHSENFGIAAAEALAAGLPVIATTGVAIAAEIERLGAGIMVPPGPEALAGAICQMANPSIRKELAARTQVAVEHYSLDGTARSLVALYGDVVRANGSVGQGRQ